MIEKRKSGYYPTQDYKESKLCCCSYGENNGEPYSYVRYTQEGEKFILLRLVENGYSLLSNKTM